MILDEKAFQLAKDILFKEGELLGVLIQMKKDSCFMALGYRSVFEYVVQRLKLSEAQGYYFQKVVEKSFEVPELKEAIVRGDLSLSKARRIVPVINSDNFELWIGKANELNQKELEKAVAVENPQSQVREQIKPLGETVTQMVVAITPEVEALLKQVKELESQRTKSASSWNESFKAMANLYLDKHDPLRKARRHLAKAKPELSEQKPAKQSAIQNSLISQQKTFLRKAPQQRIFTPAQVKHHVHHRDQHRCIAIGPDGKRCEQTRWLEIDHVVPVAKGGASTVSNLRTLCSFHHKLRHSRHSLEVRLF